LPFVKEHPLLRVPVIFAPERSGRPQLSFNDAPKPLDTCPFCPGFEYETPPAILTVGGSQWSHRLFPNKYPILDSSSNGAHEILVECRSHDELVAADSLLEILQIYRERMHHLGKTHRYVSIFKNHGRWAGESIVHPHSQILATPFVPTRVQIEQTSFAAAGDCPVCVMTSTEELLIAKTDSVGLLSPGVPRFAYETWIAPLAHEGRFEGCSDHVLRGVAEMMSSVLRTIQQVPLARSWNWSIVTAPASSTHGSFHWYIEILPRTSPLAGFELHSGSYVNVVTPEVSVARYRSAL